MSDTVKYLYIHPKLAEGIKRFWCSSCRCHTNVERNSLWDGNYKNTQDLPWYARCSECEESYICFIEGCCPECGWNPMDESDEYEHQIRCTPVYITYSSEGTFRDWTETYRCPYCKTEFEIENGD